MKAVLLNSGGLDTLVSAACGYRLGYEMHSLYVEAGQLHQVRAVASARRIAAKFCVAHKEIAITGGPYLLNDPTSGFHGSGIPHTRMLMAILGAVQAKTLGYDTVITGIKTSKAGGEFFTHLANLLACAQATVPPVFVRPVFDLSVAETVAKGYELGLTQAEMAETVSCSRGATPCGSCLRCRERKELGLD